VNRSWIAVLMGIGAGVLIGILAGWLVPIRDTSVGFDRLHPRYKADYTVMVGAAYAVNDDWDLAQARLGRLGELNPAVYVSRLAEEYIDTARHPDDIRHLVRLTARYGYTTPEMEPYLPTP
jgi:hypothetical protein